MYDLFKVVSVSPDLIQIEITKIEDFKKADDINFSIGSYLKITDDKGLSVVALIRSYRIKEMYSKSDIDIPILPKDPYFIIDAQPVGFIDKSGKFKRGRQKLTIPPNEVEIADKHVLENIYNSTEVKEKFQFSSLAQESQIKVSVDGNKFFGKHLAVLGSTGSGKSCTVAKILQEGIKPTNAQLSYGALNNTHILIFDLHGEYSSAFPTTKYAVNHLNIENLVLPYWLMNSEELEEFFIDTEANDHNQRNIFKEAVILNKKYHNTRISEEHITYDSPIKFDIHQVVRYIRNRNQELATDNKIVWEKNGDDRTLRHPDYYDLFEEEVAFKKSGKSSNTLNGKFINFLSRLENKLNDKRLSFLLNEKVMQYSLEQIIRQFIGYVNDSDERANVTIIDLSGIPFEVLSIVVSLINRLVFDFCYLYKKIKQPTKELPILIVLEEAHNYIPRTESSRYNSVRKSIERISKEGRKYGLSVMIVSQRPSEISETIFSQCNNFVIMRLTNPADQQYVKKLLPDSVSAITDNLPILEQREALIIGDSITMPSLVIIDSIDDKPDSKDIDFHAEWKKDWLHLSFKDIVATIIKEGTAG